jgi:hypothetical protein
MVAQSHNLVLFPYVRFLEFRHMKEPLLATAFAKADFPFGPWFQTYAAARKTMQSTCP